ILFFEWQSLMGQHYDIVIRGGHVIDPKNNLNNILDVAISDGKIIRVAKAIDIAHAVRVIDARDMYVVPGLIDIHTHDFHGNDPKRDFCYGTASIMPDGFTFCNGVTTVVDAGSCGWRDFPVFKKQVIDNSQTRVFAFLNIVGQGMRGGVYEQNTKDMDSRMAAITAERYRNYIVGIKVAHYNRHDWTPVDQAVKAGQTANIPVMIDFGENPSPLSLNELFSDHLRRGDILTHCFAELRGREPIVDPGSQKLKPFVWEARKKGIVFDVGYGKISFVFSQALPAVKAGFYPNSISTDMYAANKDNNTKSILNIMSKFLAMGMNIADVIKTVTWNPAREINHDEIGNISVGTAADIAILSVRHGKFDLYDHTGYTIESPKKFECEVTIRNGMIVYDSNKNFSFRD
ncbi:MAG TPA: amidohydrolase/deacetylase family metallohydrolase, partial [Puia sp.]|nr:amidohydrolase/deacetylase family metallohydrolase [Puia sp.]